MLKTISLALATAALLAAPAIAAENRDTRTTGVSFNDLDLSTDEGREELDQRIEKAAKDVCGMGERSLGSNIVTRESRQCFRNAKRDLDRHFAEVIEDQRRGG